MSVATMDRVSPQEAFERINEDGSCCAIDVRSPAEYRAIHATCAKSMPLDRLDVDAIRREAPADGPLFVLCKSGARAKMACERLRDAGVENAVVVDGGTDAWAAAGLPVERGEGGAIGIERQVRIVAGAIVFLGAVLAVTVHAYFAFISMFVGGGLMFAGITDTCMMGLLLARMPWNR